MDINCSDNELFLFKKIALAAEDRSHLRRSHTGLWAFRSTHLLLTVFTTPRRNYRSALVDEQCGTAATSSIGCALRIISLIRRDAADMA